MSAVEAMMLEMPRETVRVWLALQRVIPKNAVEVTLDPAELAREAEVGERQVRRALSHLEHHGYLRRISHPPRPTKVILNRGINADKPKSPQVSTIEPPADVVDRAAKAVHRYWSALWAEKFGITPVFVDSDLLICRAMVIRNWDRGMDYVKMQVRAVFDEHGAPLLSKVEA